MSFQWSVLCWGVRYDQNGTRKVSLVVRCPLFRDVLYSTVDVEWLQEWLTICLELFVSKFFHIFIISRGILRIIDGLMRWGREIVNWLSRGRGRKRRRTVTNVMNRRYCFLIRRRRREIWSTGLNWFVKITTWPIEIKNRDDGMTTFVSRFTICNTVESRLSGLKNIPKMGKYFHSPFNTSKMLWTKEILSWVSSSYLLIL